MQRFTAEDAETYYQSALTFCAAVKEYLNHRYAEDDSSVSRVHNGFRLRTLFFLCDCRRRQLFSGSGRCEPCCNDTSAKHGAKVTENGSEDSGGAARRYARVTVDEKGYFVFTGVFRTEGEVPANLCKLCEKDRSGRFGQKIVGFFHNILCFFAHLFGKR